MLTAMVTLVLIAGKVVLRMLTSMVTLLLIAGKVSAAHADGDGDLFIDCRQSQCCAC
jgi:hypothetical protein